MKYLGGICRKFPNNNLLHNQVFEFLKQLTHLLEECTALWTQVYRLGYVDF